MAARSREKAEAQREIGEDFPAVANPRRRAKALKSLAHFCKSYFPRVFKRPFSDDHLKVIAAIETAVNTGGLFCLAMPRGSGKSRLSECAALWASFKGRAPYVLLIGASADAASGMLKTLKTYLESNDELAADFPEICHPIRRLEGINQRKLLFNGEPIKIQFTARFIVLPSLPRNPAAGNVIEAVGITGSFRGRAFTRPDGSNVRPSLVILDDPQTDESAESPSQVRARERKITGTILGLAGPGEDLAAVMPCTVIAPGDLADRFLDPQIKPEWQGIRTQLVYEWPTDPEAVAHWDRYLEIRRDAFARKLGTGPQNSYYREHRATMDKGARVGWPQRYKPNELSALQHAYNLRADAPDTFDADYQNAPKKSQALEAALSPAEILAKCTGARWGHCPTWAQWVTAGIDVQGEALFWLVAAWGADFSGQVIAYGAHPEQPTRYWTLAKIRRKLSTLHPGPLETSLAAGLEALGTALAGQTWTRPDGTDLPIARLLVDANWNESEAVVYRWTTTPTGRRLNALPSHGRYVGAKTRPMSEWKLTDGDAQGDGWRLPARGPGKLNRAVMFDANYWKTTLADRWRLPPAAPGGLALCGEADDHTMLADQLTAEYPVRVTAKGRTVTEWMQKPGGPDNHWLDCVNMSAVGASICGAKLDASPAAKPAGKKRPRRGVTYH